MFLLVEVVLLLKLLLVELLDNLSRENFRLASPLLDELRLVLLPLREVHLLDHFLLLLSSLFLLFLSELALVLHPVVLDFG